MKMVVIQNTVIDSFCTCSVLIDLFPFTGFIKERPAIAGIFTISDINGSSISGRAAFIFMRAMINLSHGKRAPEFTSSPLMIISVVDHLKTSSAYRNTILIDSFFLIAGI